jgi:hypothetical protein
VLYFGKEHPIREKKQQKKSKNLAGKTDFLKELPTRLILV